MTRFITVILAAGLAGALAGCSPGLEKLGAEVRSSYLDKQAIGDCARASPGELAADAALPRPRCAAERARDYPDGN